MGLSHENKKINYTRWSVDNVYKVNVIKKGNMLSPKESYLCVFPFCFCQTIVNVNKQFKNQFCT